MAEFKLPPISTLAGTTLSNYFKVLRGNRIDRKYYLKTLLTGLIATLGTPFQWYEGLKFNKKVRAFEFKEPPLFVVGHWRGGTTYIHNLMCQDPQAGYITTYQSVFPNNLSSKILFKTFMKATMPDKRPSDNVKLSINFPQEEEFALGNLHPYSYYNLWFFPERYKEYYEKYVRFNQVSDDVKKTWKSEFQKLVIKSLLNTSGQRAIIKNPVNTGRIQTLLEIFPEAKFIHIYRNPIIVFLSTRKFFLELMPTLTFQNYTDDEVVEMNVLIYKMIYEDYLNQKKLIPKNNLIELKFEDFESDPIYWLKYIYEKFEYQYSQDLETTFKNYITSLGGYKKNKYKIQKEDLNMVLDNWGEYMKHFEYELPENLEII